MYLYYRKVLQINHNLVIVIFLFL